MDKLTTKSQEALAQAIRTATDAGNPQVEPVHLLSALLGQEGGIALALLEAVGANRVDIAERVAGALASLPRSAGDSVQNPAASRPLSRVISEAGKEATSLGDAYISTEHLLMAIAASQSQAGEILRGAGASHEALRATLPRVRTAKVDSADPEGTFQALEKYGQDLTAMAREGKMDPVIGRDSEIRRVVQVLSRRTKNNPVLIGEPGVGKTAVVEGLAQRMVNGDVPESLRGKRLIQLDVASMVAGAKYRGEFEERFKAVLNEIKEAAGEIVTFIDEIHTIVGAGGGSEGAMDAGNMLKPMLARGELRLIGATTLDEYRENIEKDPALERRFQQIFVGEPSVEDTITILRGIAPKYEAHHKVTITDGALVAAAQLSNRYITGRQLPDKAIDLIDEAASRLRMELDSSPEEIDVLQRQVDRLTMEESYLSETQDDDAATADRLETIRAELADRKEELAALTARWENEKAGRNRVGDLRVKLDELRTEFELAVREGRYEDAGRLQNGDIPEVERQIAAAEAEEASGASRDHEPMIAERVDSEEVAEVVAAWTGVPVGKLMQGETEKLLHMEEEIGRRLIGQQDAVRAVSDAVRRSRAGVQDPNRPDGSFLFLGPTGVGKTELAKSLADFMFDDERAMVRIDMSEYAEKHSVSRLVGAPPGYVGYEEGGQLTEAVRRRPYSVILLDEVEKAHPDVFDILLQVLDDGRLTDGQGRTVDFRNTLLILTSNLGSQALADPTLDAAAQYDTVMAAVRAHFKPEFLNRLDDVIVFHPLSMEEIGKIVDLQITQLEQRLGERRMHLDVSPAARDYLTMDGYDPAYGARPLRRLIQREIGDQLARMILAGEAHDGDTIRVDTQENATASGGVPGRGYALRLSVES
ncbi:ATP-dependent chaperone ClpB [Actinotignum sanguinis]|uniref:Chaperone protein ClpB n=2 Tax=Actinomycetaceae TaxID=2049 RepID=A0ABZ0RE46_9ACTO|nr:ATP-dependent chaperone ClpB [Actinotignum sanguinis]WPJ89067.1 ATP-dependent chaperone ClpB [Schaalia turicensis]MDE1553692.1 ATP-dependent chaperone ClpB [Actinotignum sanguinis]MDE1564664.1 ATP-dependent chaperone ClpB [Actinotignum sanguinis]MDE1576699.1 ATP-dependent chaperone ClpB [Actinotignum sanguinis]MDE1642601.1 ATP-dependent chaperone ClpB [Actinotignum sanguinis]